MLVCLWSLNLTSLIPGFHPYMELRNLQQKTWASWPLRPNLTTMGLVHLVKWQSKYNDTGVWQRCNEWRRGRKKVLKFPKFVQWLCEKWTPCLTFVCKGNLISSIYIFYIYITINYSLGMSSYLFPKPWFWKNGTRRGVPHPKMPVETSFMGMNA